MKNMSYDPQPIFDFCKKHDMTTKELAEKAGMGLSTVNAIRCRVYHGKKKINELFEFIKDYTHEGEVSPGPICTTERVKSIGELIEELRKNPAVEYIQVTFKVKK